MYLKIIIIIIISFFFISWRIFNNSDDEMTCYEYSENYIFIGYKSGKIFLWEKNSREIAAILSDPKNSCGNFYLLKKIIF